ncbi:hypothetical protein GGR55DRAFT_632412 [Xylaria sp. FL0064]|nr:hypothetical protein GGR55DRAFT_632412 [Xylaria sp. FL0064]
MFAKWAILVSWPTRNTTSLPTAVIQSSSCGLAHDPVRGPSYHKNPPSCVQPALTLVRSVRNNTLIPAYITR